MYRIKSTGEYPVTKQDLIRRNPHISLPAEWDDTVLALLGVDYVTPTAKPAITATQRLVEGAPVLANGKWMQTWAVQDMAQEEIEAQVVAKKSAATKQCDDACQDYIFAGYSQTKQNNINAHVALRGNPDAMALMTPEQADALYTNQDAVTMALFISEARGVCFLAKQAVDACTTVEEVDAVLAQFAELYTGA